MGEFAEDIFGRENVGDETKANSIMWFKTLFAEGNSVKTAIATNVEFLEGSVK